MALHLPFDPPLEPMLAKAADGLPTDGWLFEPKWDGFRAIVFRDGDEVLIAAPGPEAARPLFPGARAPLRRPCPSDASSTARSSSPRDGGLDFEALLLRIHRRRRGWRCSPRQTPGVLRRLGPAGARRRGPARRARRGSAARGSRPRSADATPPVHLTPATLDRAAAADWFDRFEGAGLDGVIAKRLDGAYQPGKRAMLKIKHQRTADCVVAGFRWHKNGPGTHIGSLLLGLFDDDGQTPPRRRDIDVHLGSTGRARCRAGAAARGRPRRPSLGRMGGVGGAGAADASRSATARARRSRWNRGKDLSWEPLRTERVAEVAYDHLQGDRFRHGRPSSAGARTSRRPSAATTSSKRRRPTCWLRFSGRR